MKKHYLHLSAYTCDLCAGPVVAGSVAVRENVISKEIDIRQVGAICLTCAHRQDPGTDPGRIRHFFPIEWNPEKAPATETPVGALNRAEPH